MDAIAEAYVRACMLELEALKPGNVHRYANGHGMTCSDLEISAKVSAPGVTRKGASVGARIYEAVAATRAAVGQNTNLGIVLLCAPLAAAAERGEPLRQTLDSLTVEDSRSCFAAIALAKPGGLGSAPHHDVHFPPTAALLEAMAAAAERDLIARQYANGFADIAGLGLSNWRKASSCGDSAKISATSVYLGFLKTWPDTHIARKFGREVAEAVRKEAEDRVRQISEPGQEQDALLLDWDRDLKARGMNPGACADLTVATLFSAFLADHESNVLRLLPNSD